ncbi:hypothetical protein KSS87_000178 [Heliosperma pusillum]|nr:hypothetical protein KSS87_000178 [Heliosperma pusillum]
MAKFGEGDKRWIVEERPDGTNVHNWHWAETDCLEYSRTLFTNSLANLPILTGDGGLFIRITTLDKLEGESYVNIRKGKIIPGYELSLKLSWHGEAKDASENSLLSATGSVEIPYISDENAGEAPEIRISFSDDGPIGKRIKDAFVSKGKPLILEKVKEYEEAMSKGGPCRGASTVSAPGSAAAAAAGTKVELPAAEKKHKEKEKEKRGFKTIKMTEKFRCRAVDLYEIMMDENRWRGFTQSNAKISKDVGGEFTIFDGSVNGINLDLKEGQFIHQKWRFGNWPDGVFSTVKLTFEEPETGVTLVKLVQTDVPEEDRWTTCFMPLRFGMAMKQWWRTQREAGEILSSRGFEPSSALVFDVTIVN